MMQESVAEDTTEIAFVMEALEGFRCGKKIPQPPPGSGVLDFRVYYEDGTEISCTNEFICDQGVYYAITSDDLLGSSYQAESFWKELTQLTSEQ